MTLLTAHRCRDGLIFTTDSRLVTGPRGDRLASDVIKLAVINGFLVAAAGWEDVTQAFALALQRAENLSPTQDRLLVRGQLRELVKQVQNEGGTDTADWLIGWWSEPEQKALGLRLATSSDRTTWVEQRAYGGDSAAIRIARPLEAALRFVPIRDLTVDRGRLVALKVMRDTLHVGVESIGGAPQIGTVTEDGPEILSGSALRALHDAVDVWEEEMAALLPGGVAVPAQSVTPDRGLRIPRRASPTPAPR